MRGVFKIKICNSIYNTGYKANSRNIRANKDLVLVGFNFSVYVLNFSFNTNFYIKIIVFSFYISIIDVFIFVENIKANIFGYDINVSRLVNIFHLNNFFKTN